jgi:hypothetical protein
MSFAPDLASWIGGALGEIAIIARTVDGVRVTTHCMYPSNGLVRVLVRGGVETVVISDEGGAVGEALSAGIPVKEYNRTLSHLIKDQGLYIKNGVIFTSQIPMEAAPLGILHVANASQEIARWMYDHMKIKRTRDFKIMLAEFLQSTFDNRVLHNEIIVGHSNKPHKFANVVKLLDGRRLIIDPVNHEASSINARVVANLDVKATNNPLLDQRIVYDDEEEWTPADLNLLQVGATVIPWSRSREVIARIAKSAQNLQVAPQ